MILVNQGVELIWEKKLMRFKGILFIILLGLSQQLLAAGFALKEQSVSYLGTSFAGTASAAIDANTSFYNPAGLVLLPYNQVTLAATYIAPKTELTDGFARNNAGAVVTNSSTTARPKGNELVPGFAVAYKYNKCLTFGFTVGSPFGMSTEYGSDDIARYMATKSSLTMIDFSPAVGYRINRCWMIGAGFDAIRVKATLDSAFNAGLGEGFGKNTASGWVYGYHLGIMFMPTSDVQMGLAYFSPFKPRVDGVILTRNTVPPVPTSLTAAVNVPDRVVYGVTYKYNDRWTAMGEVEWTQWARLKTLVLNYNTNRFSQEDLYYKNAWRFSFGVEYQCVQKLKLKGGVSFDQTPVTDDHRTARLPDSDRTWLSVGASYKCTKCLILDAGYAYLFFKDRSINQWGAGTDTNKFLSGNYKGSANIVGVQLTWNFM